MKMNCNRHSVLVLLLLAAGVRRHAVVAPIMLATLLAGTSCGGDMDPGPQDASASWRLSEEPGVVIGGADEREGYLLHWVTGATRLGDGRIVVANESTSELKYYDPEGTHLFDTGGEGGGPGEFVGSLQRLTRTPGDSVLVLSSQSEITRFGPDGRYASSSRYRLPPSGHCRRIAGRQRLVPDGSIVLGYGFFVGRGGECPPPSPGEARQPMVVGRFVPATEAFDTIAELPAAEIASDPETMRAYPRNRVYGIGHDRIYLGDTGSDAILAMSFSGDRIAALPVPFEPAPVPADAKEKLVPGVGVHEARAKHDPKLDADLSGLLSSLRTTCGGSRGPGLGDGLSAPEGPGDVSGRSDPSEDFPPPGRWCRLEGGRS